MIKKKIKKIEPKQESYNIDASGKIFGRLASEIAFILRGKKSQHWQPHHLPHQKVIVSNLSKIIITGKKLKQKKYHHFTGYPGGIRTYSLEELWQKNPAQLLKNAVYHMLPKNKLRDKIMHNLIVKN